MTVCLSASVPGRSFSPVGVWRPHRRRPRLAPGRAGLGLGLMPWVEAAVVGVMRSREDIEDLYHTAAAGPADAGLDGGWTLGVADALAWVLGRSEIAPATLDASLAWPSVDEVMAEREVANAVVEGRTDVHDRPREWMVGVEYALRWAAGGT